MINLILTEDKNRVRHNYRARVALVAAGLFLALLLIFLVGLGSLYLVVTWRQSAIAGSLETARQGSAGAKFDTLEGELRGLAEKVKILKIDQETNLPASQIWRRLIDKRRPGITLRGLFFSRSPSALGEAILALDGNAVTHQQFVDFIDSLKADKLLSDIEYPISYQIKESDIDFLINFKIKATPATLKNEN
ncbi:MAG: hypothetical protein AAB453_02010 [Patescibacteria group bacterium]